MMPFFPPRKLSWNRDYPGCQLYYMLRHNSGIKKLVCIMIAMIISMSTGYATNAEVLKVKNIYRSGSAFSVSESQAVDPASAVFADTLGEMRISAADEMVVINGEEYDTYLVKNGSSAQFSYSAIKDLTKPITVERWGLDSDGISRIGDYDWKRGIGKGGILIRKSFDREKWETVYTNTDVFKDYQKEIHNFYSASRADLNQGCYYEVVIAYRKAIKTKDGSFIGIFDASEYKRAFCVEVYDFYVAAIEKTETAKISVDGPAPDLGEEAAWDGSFAVGSQTIANQIAGQEVFITNPNGGKGFAAEAANIQIEKINSIGTGIKVKHTGDNNVYNGEDYIIEQKNGTLVQVQTKYYQDAGATIRACFDENGVFRYSNTETGKPMQIEVPRDQYDKAVALMKEKILNNQIPGVTDPAEAENIVRKGSVTFQQAVNIAKAGTIDSLIYDAKNATVVSTASMGISAVIQFAACIWNHEDVETALKTSLFTGLRTLGNTFVISVLASQLGRTSLQSLMIPGSQAVVKAIGPKASAVIINAARIGLKPIYGAAAMSSAAKLLRSNVVTAIASFVIFTIPDTVDLISGRISTKQMLKNIAGTMGSIGGGFAGMALGAAAGSAFPGPGNVIGGIIGGIAGGIGGHYGMKALTDLIAEDDAKEMLAIIETEFQNIAEENIINQEEADVAISALEKKLTPNDLKDMFASGNHHKYARDIIQPLIEEAISGRAKVILPSEEEIQAELIETLEEIYDELPPEMQMLPE